MMSISKISSVLAALSVAAACAQAQPAPAAEPPPKPISLAERLLFMSDQLKGVHTPTVLEYDFKRSGSLEAPFQDTAKVMIDARPAGGCCLSKGDFLHGEHHFEVPEVDSENALGNQVILYFLERDITEMQRLTKGSKVHFQRQIRRALVDVATVTDSSFSYNGKFVTGKKITVAPYADDVLRPKFEKFAKKHYVFMLSEAVPGGVYGMRTQMDGETDAAGPLIVEELFLHGADGTEAKMTSNP